MRSIFKLKRKLSLTSMCSHTYLQKPYEHKRNAISNRNYIYLFFLREILVLFSDIKLLAEILILNARWFSYFSSRIVNITFTTIVSQMYSFNDEDKKMHPY